MNDTPTAVAGRYRRMLMERSGVERLRMGFEMFDAARALVRASLKEEQQIRIQMLQRFYAQDLDQQTLRSVAERLRNR